jgi:hypothetical protein
MNKQGLTAGVLGRGLGTCGLPWHGQQRPDGKGRGTTGQAPFGKEGTRHERASLVHA